MSIHDEIVRADLRLRPITSADKQLLFQIYAASRAEEMARVAWGEAQQGDFLRMQFDAQHHFYQEQFAGARFDIIEWQGIAAGRLYVDRRDEEIRVIDIALLPEYRNRGIGSGLLEELLGEAAALSLPVRIHVEQFNPALSLYSRLGFVPVRLEGVHQLMEWSTSTVPLSSDRPAV